MVSARLSCILDVAVSVCCENARAAALDSNITLLCGVQRFRGASLQRLDSIAGACKSSGWAVEAEFADMVSLNGRGVRAQTIVSSMKPIAL